MSNADPKLGGLRRLANLIVGASTVSLIVLAFLGAYALGSWIF